MSDRDQEFEGTTDKQLEHLLSELREIYSQQYARGSRDAIAKLAQLAQNPLAPRAGAIQEKVARTPRGSSRKFVEKALRSGARTIAEIRGSAHTDIERGLSYQTLRLELERGKKDRRYKKVDGKWTLSK